jgi:putative ABC transport system permease protein
VRRVSGADGRQLLLQFLGEGLLVSGIAFVFALGLTVPGLGLLNAVTGKTLEPHVLLRGSLLLWFAALLPVSGLLAGIYPAIFITRLKLTALLKGQPGGNRSSGRRVRQSLIVMQFVIAITLVIGAMVIQRQLSYLRNKPLGFDKEQLVVAPLFGKSPSPLNSGVDGPLRARMNAFENELRANPAIRAVTLSSVLPGDPFVTGLVIPEGHTEKDNIFIPWASVDYDFLSTIGAPLVAGRDFSKATGTDHLQAFVINESAVRTFGWKSASEAIGKSMVRGDAQSGKKGQVIGVIKDFNFGRLDRPQQPLILDVNVPRFTTFAIRIRPDHVPQTIAAIRQSWDHYFPERIFDYSFLDENINALYKAQENLSRLVRYFALVAIFISCSGLFALVAFMAAQRMREIGIRKVLGASVASLVFLLFRDFLRLVLLALLISIPLAWWAMNRWLHDFAYRISLSWWIFTVAGLLAVVIAFLTVGMQGLRVSRVSPVKSLRSE